MAIPNGSLRLTRGGRHTVVARPPRGRLKPFWTADEIAVLRAGLLIGRDPNDIGAALRRTREAVYNKAKALGIWPLTRTR